MGDNADNKGGSGHTVISRDLSVTGTGRPPAGYVTANPSRDAPQNRGRTGHSSSDSPSLSARRRQYPGGYSPSQDLNRGSYPLTQSAALTHEWSSESSSPTPGVKETAPSNLDRATTYASLVTPARECDPSSLQRGNENISPSNELLKPAPASLASPSNPSGTETATNVRVSSGLKTKLFVPEPSQAGPKALTRGGRGVNLAERTQKGSVSSPREQQTKAEETQKGSVSSPRVHQTKKVSAPSSGELRVGVDSEALRSALTLCFSGRPPPSFQKGESLKAKVNAGNTTTQNVTSTEKLNQGGPLWNRLAQSRPRQSDTRQNTSQNTSPRSSENLQPRSSGDLKTAVNSRSVLEQGGGTDWFSNLGAGSGSDVAEISTRSTADYDDSLGKDPASRQPLKEKAIQSDLCEQPNRSPSPQTGSGNQLAREETSAAFAQHSSQPATVPIETHALSRQPAFCQESYHCGGAVSVLPPIVERAEGDVSTFPPISEPGGVSDVTAAAAMPADWNLQKLDASRGRRVIVQPFFRKKSHDCDNCQTPRGTAGNEDTEGKVPISKVRKSGSHQLPSFILRQTSLVRDPPQQQQQQQQQPDMASKKTKETLLTPHSKNAASKRTGGGGTKRNKAQNCSEDSSATSTNLEHPDAQITKASPRKTDGSGKVMYDVFMDNDNDTIRVDISGSDPTVPTETSGGDESKLSSHSSNNNSPHPSVTEDDDFPENQYSFQEWSEEKESRALRRQDSKHGFLKQDSPGGRCDEKPYLDSKTCSDSALLQRSSHHSLGDVLADGKSSERQTMRRLGSSVSEPSALSPVRRHSLAVNLDSDKVRRNSVSILRARPTRVSSPHSRSVSQSDRVVASVPKRRHSSKQTLDKFLRQESQTSFSRQDIAASLEFLTWTHLLSTYPQSDVSVTTVEKTEVVVTIPVCYVSKGSSIISVTSVEAIEQTLTNFHPNLQILLGSLSSKYDPSPTSQPSEDHSSAHPGAQLPGTAPSFPEGGVQRQLPMVNTILTADVQNSEGPLSPSLTEDAKDEMTRLDVGNKKGLNTKSRSSNTLGSADLEGNPRRVSINTCIRTMRESSGNYDSQLIGCRNVGTYAEEETLKVVLAKSDAISCVINAMKTFMEKEELQRQACASLLKMASTSEANCAYIIQNGGVTALTNTMRRYEDHVDLTRQALGILGYISATEDVKAQLLGYGCHGDVLAAMSRHSDDRHIVCQCCFILGNLVISVDTAQQLMLVGGVHTIISMLKRYHDDRDILENGCRALGSFALYDDTCLDVAQAGATATVVEAMRSMHRDDSVLESACWALACLTSKTVTCEELVALQGVEELVVTLENYPKEELLQEYGVRALCNLAARESTAGDVCTSRVVRVLTSLHRNFADNVELMECMMLAMSLVAAVDAELQQYLLTSGGLKTVVTVMKSLDENPAIQENGCRTLGNMAVNESLRKATEQQGASQAVIAAMLNIDMCPDIQLYGCMALMNLTADLMDNKMRVKNNGAVPTLLSTLRNFPDSPEVVLSALKTLGNLVDLEEACRQLLDDRGLTTIIQIAKNNRADDNIRAFAALVLSGLTALSDLVVEDLLEVEETLVTLQAALPHDPDLALSMCQGLHNLLKSEVGLDTLGQTGWMEVIENTMTTFSTHPDIHLTACRIVGTVAMEYGRRVKKSQCPLCARTVRSVLQSMRQFPAHKELQIVGCGTLSCVSETFDHLRKAILEECGLGDVFSAMTSFPNDDRLHSVGLIALSFLLPADVSEAVQDGRLASEVISRSMSQFVENEDIQITACRALERCQTSDVDNVYQLLTCVHNAVRRHSKKVKVIRACQKVFTKFGGERAEDLTETIINSPTGSPKVLLKRLLKK